MSINRPKTATFTFVLMLTIAATLVTCTPTAAQQLTTFAYLAIAPKTIGLGQYVLVNAWVTPPPSLNAAGVPIIYHNFTFVITKPGGGSDTKVVANSEGPGTVYFTYTPAAVGTYSIVFTWAGQADRAACESPPVQFTVQQEPPAGYPPAELPTGYWDRPISAESREWYQISGGWSEGSSWSNYNGSAGCYNPYSKAPNTAHVLWTKDDGMGGLVGGEYLSKFASVSVSEVIMMGRVYYLAAGSLYCVDLRTGKELWKVTGASGTIAAMPMYTTPPGISGALGWRIGGIWLVSVSAFTLYDPYTGAVLRNIPGPGAPWGTADLFVELVPNTGEYYFYMKSWDRAYKAIYYKWDARMAAAAGGTFRSNLVWMQNITQTPEAGDSHSTVYGKVFVGCLHYYKLGFDTATGTLLYNSTNPSYEQTEPRASGYNMVFVPSSADRMYRGYDINTGNVVWTSEAAKYPWGAFWTYGTGVAYNKIYAGAYDGYLYCFDAKTGDTVWKYYSGDDPTGNTPYGDWPFYGTPAIADGKIYKATTEHSPTQPFVRGFRLYCFDADTGDNLWSISGAFGSRDIAIGDGALISTNAYQGLLYCFDKGQTSTTISVSPKTQTNGTSVLIEGTVLDQSPAQPGTPCVSKEDMTAWMEYLHMQKPLPGGLSNVTGVPVQLIAVRSDGSTINIGTVETDCQGHFSKVWVPTEKDTYAITATFGGDDSYYMSWAETALGVTQASQTSSQTQTQTQAAIDYTPLLVGILVAVIIAIIIGAANLIWKRK